MINFRNKNNFIITYLFYQCIILWKNINFNARLLLFSKDKIIFGLGLNDKILIKDNIDKN